MAETYEEIVKKWYMKLRGNFMNLMMDKYKNTNMASKKYREIGARESYDKAFAENDERSRLIRLLKKSKNWKQNMARQDSIGISKPRP